MIRDYSNILPSNASGATSERHRSNHEILGRQPFFAQQTDIEELTQTLPVRVIEVHRNGLHVMGENIDQMVPPRPDATVGDWLLLDRANPLNSRILERTSLLKRRAPGSDRREQLIAANIDTCFVVTSCNQDFNVARLERYIALCFEAKITPVIVITKVDLIADFQPFVDKARDISDRVPVVALDARGDDPKTALAEWCRPGQTVAFLGSSGVGKSTLTNALYGIEAIETQAIREDDAKGRHTTTRRQLYLVPLGCMVLDTPGMRELQLTDAASGIDGLFADIHALSLQCRFNDCQHETEPGCAVLKALDAGQIEKARLQRWRKLLAEDTFNSISLAERRSQQKAFGKMVREATKRKSRSKRHDC